MRPTLFIFGSLPRFTHMRAYIIDDRAGVQPTPDALRLSHRLSPGRASELVSQGVLKWQAAGHRLTHQWLHGNLIEAWRSRNAAGENDAGDVCTCGPSSRPSQPWHQALVQFCSPAPLPHRSVPMFRLHHSEGGYSCSKVRPVCKARGEALSTWVSKLDGVGNPDPRTPSIDKSIRRPFSLLFSIPLLR